MTGWRMLLLKEVTRFWRVAFQTIAAPVLTALMYLLIFGHVLRDHVEVYPGVTYLQFLVPGLMMMSVLQNAFANSSSSLVQSKMMGNLVFLLLTPLTAWHWFLAYVLSSVVRGLAVGVGIGLVTAAVVSLPVHSVLWVVAFAVLGSAMLGAMGVIAGLWADKFDQMAAFQNFVIMPMTFLSGVFYSIHSLPDFWQQVSRVVKGVVGEGILGEFFGHSDVSPWLSLSLLSLAWGLVSGLAFYLLHTGYKIRS